MKIVVILFSILFTYSLPVMDTARLHAVERQGTHRIRPGDPTVLKNNEK